MSLKRLERNCTWGSFGDLEVNEKNGRFPFKSITREHNPDFCGRFGFILSVDVLCLFVDLFDVVPAFKIDDVYVGMLAARAGVKGTNHPGFKHRPWPPSVACDRGPEILVWHGIIGECLFKLFRLSF